MRCPTSFPLCGTGGSPSKPGQDLMLLCLRREAIIGPTSIDQGPGRCAEAPQAAQTPPLISWRSLCSLCLMVALHLYREVPDQSSHFSSSAFQLFSEHGRQSNLITARTGAPVGGVFPFCRGTRRDSCPCLQTASDPSLLHLTPPNGASRWPMFGRYSGVADVPTPLHLLGPHTPGLGHPRAGLRPWLVFSVRA